MIYKTPKQRNKPAMYQWIDDDDVDMKTVKLLTCSMLQALLYVY